MSLVVWRSGLVLMAALALAACTSRPVAKAPPRPAPEPRQAPPSAEALGPARIAEQACAASPGSGEVLEGEVSEDGLHFYEIQNSTAVPAIVKLRRDVAGPMVVAVYIAPGKTAQIGPLDDGVYRATYAMGRALAADCRHIDFPSGYGQYDKSETFSAGDDNGSPVGRTAHLVLEDGDVDGGEGPQALSAEKFNAP